jgi:hypothetical protein
MNGVRTVLIALLGSVVVSGCASAPDADPDSATVWGFVRLVPKSHVSPAGGGYGDRRLEGVKRVDYSHSGYAVVYVPTSSPLDFSPLELAIEETRKGLRIVPSIGSTNPAAGVRIRNNTDRAQFVSAPGSSWLERIDPRGVAQIDDPVAGELNLHLLGAEEGAGVAAQVWVANGARAEIESSGRYVIQGLQPGRHELRAWHPRLPPSPVHGVDLSLGGVHQVDLEIGVDVQARKEEIGR